MTDDAPAGADAVVPFLSLVACNLCRRRRGAQFHRTGRVESVPLRGTCPHGKPLRKLWAPGEGPRAAGGRRAGEDGPPAPWDASPPV